jgi:hypothetical protein
LRVGASVESVLMAVLSDCAIAFSPRHRGSIKSSAALFIVIGILNLMCKYNMVKPLTQQIPG